MSVWQKLSAAVASAAVILSAAGANAQAAPYSANTSVEMDTTPGARGTIAILPDTQFYSRYAAEGNDL